MKNRSPHTIWIAIAFIIPQACNSSSSGNSVNSGSTLNEMSASDHTNPDDYAVFDRVRVVDRMGFAEPAFAYSLLIPRGWSYEGNINWILNPQTGYGNGTFNHFNATSADGLSSFEMLPEFSWLFNSDPQLTQMMQQSMRGLSNVTVAEPMGAEQYLRNFFSQQELRGAEIISVTQAPAVVQEMQASVGNKLDELRQYGAADVKYHPTAIRADVRWSDGTLGIVMVGVAVIETLMYNQYTGQAQTSYTSTASKRIIYKFPAAKKEEAEKNLPVMLGSMRVNPVWQNAVNKFWKDMRQQSHIAHVGRIQVMDAQTRAIGEAAIQRGNQNLANMDMQMKTWEQGQASQDRMHSGFIKTIREVETYQDATGTVELSSGYNHAWSRSDGSSFVMTNDPNFNPSSVFQDQRWQEMKLIK
jgi:hypothetical protein